MNAAALERYVEFMEAIRSAVPAALPAVVSPDIHFRDPFNETFGIAHYTRVLEDMIEKLDELEIAVTHAALAAPRHGATVTLGLLRWRLSGRLSALGGRAWQVTGCSELAFADDGRECAHFDHWDAAGQLYESLPLIGRCLRYVRGRLRVA